jgi:hypothetical protein
MPPGHHSTEVIGQLHREDALLAPHSASYYQPNECSVVVTAALANGSGSIHLSLSSSSTGEI